MESLLPWPYSFYLNFRLVNSSALEKAWLTKNGLEKILNFIFFAGAFIRGKKRGS